MLAIKFLRICNISLELRLWLFKILIFSLEKWKIIACQNFSFSRYIFHTVIGYTRFTIALLNGMQFSIPVRLTREVNFRKRCRLWERKIRLRIEKRSVPGFNMEESVGYRIFTRFQVELSDSAACQNFHFIEIKNIISRLEGVKAEIVIC